MSAAERVCDCDEGVQWPNDRNPMLFMPGNLGIPGRFATPYARHNAIMPAPGAERAVAIGRYR